MVFGISAVLALGISALYLAAMWGAGIDSRVQIYLMLGLGDKGIESEFRIGLTAILVVFSAALAGRRSRVGRWVGPTVAILVAALHGVAIASSMVRDQSAPFFEWYFGEGLSFVAFLVVGVFWRRRLE